MGPGSRGSLPHQMGVLCGQHAVQDLPALPSGPVDSRRVVETTTPCDVTGPARGCDPAPRSTHMSPTERLKTLSSPPATRNCFIAERHWCGVGKAALLVIK